MGLLHRIEEWSATHHPRWLILLRVALGICLFLKGIAFLSSTVNLQSILEESKVVSNMEWLSVVITWLHLICGFLIIAGLFTRMATLIMIPILLAAVIFVNAPKGVFAGESEFVFSVLILLMLIFFFIEGGGPLSLDNYFRKNP